MMELNVLTLVLLYVTASVGAASNSTSPDWYTEPEEINDSIPVAITILVILILLLLIFIIILLLVCIRLLSRFTRSKDLEQETAVKSYRNDETTYQQANQPPAQHMEPIGQHQHQYTPVVYMSPQTQLKQSDSTKTYSLSGHACISNECKDIGEQRGDTQFLNIAISYLIDEQIVQLHVP